MSEPNENLGHLPNRRDYTNVPMSDIQPAPSASVPPMPTAPPEEPSVSAEPAPAPENANNSPPPVNANNGCPICWESMESYFISTQTTECNHTFHRGCLERWLDTHNTCPVCRTELFEQQLIQPDIPFLFRCWNCRLCIAPTFQRALQIRLVVTTIFWILCLFFTYNFITSFDKFTDIFLRPWNMVWFIIDVVIDVFLTYEVVCLFFRCRYDTGRIRRLELDDEMV